MSTISINPGLALRLDPIVRLDPVDGIRVVGTDTHTVVGAAELHAVLSAEVSQYLTLENPGPPKPMFTDGGPGPLTMLLSLSVVEDGNIEALLKGREDEQGGYLGVGFRGTIDERERLDAWLQMVSSQYASMVLGPKRPSDPQDPVLTESECTELGQRLDTLEAELKRRGAQ